MIPCKGCPLYDILKHGYQVFCYFLTGGNKRLLAEDATKFKRQLALIKNLAVYGKIFDNLLINGIVVDKKIRRSGFFSLNMLKSL
jgi:hypothetical protein